MQGRLLKKLIYCTKNQEEYPKCQLCLTVGLLKWQKIIK